MKIASTGVPTRFSTGGLTVALAPALRELDLKLLGMQWDTSSLVSSCPEYKSLLLVAGQSDIRVRPLARGSDGLQD